MHCGQVHKKANWTNDYVQYVEKKRERKEYSWESAMGANEKQYRDCANWS